MHVVIVERVGLKQGNFSAKWLVEVGIQCELT
jgi:hypothetical protein